MAEMSPYDTNLLALARANPETIAEVVNAFRAIDDLLPANDGLKWFNWLYLQVTEAGAKQDRRGWIRGPLLGSSVWTSSRVDLSQGSRKL
jgi:hypothetical protein